MKITWNNNEIEIRVKNEYNDKATKQDTMQFINQLLIWSYEAAETNKRRGFDMSAENAMSFNKEVYQQLEKKGFYDFCK